MLPARNYGVAEKARNSSETIEFRAVKTVGMRALRVSVNIGYDFAGGVAGQLMLAQSSREIRQVI